MNLREGLEQSGLTLRRRALGADQLAVLAKLVPASYAARNLLWERPELTAALEFLGIDRLASEALGEGAFPVNVLFLDKTAEANWKVPGHQDLMVPVERETDELGFSGWTTKHGVIHVEPPAELLEKLVIVRIHLDDCPASNGALAVIPGSHRRGKLGDAALAELSLDSFTLCEAAAGDVLLLRPLLVHRSSPSEAPGHRRVLQVVYATDRPGKKVRWKRAPLSKDRTPAPVPLPVVEPEEMAPRPEKPQGRVKRILLSLVGIGIILGGVGVVIAVVRRVDAGRGGEIYRAMSGYRLSYIGALVLVIALPLSLIAGHLSAHWQRRHERDFDRRFPRTRRH